MMKVWHLRRGSGGGPVTAAALGERSPMPVTQLRTENFFSER